MIYSLIFNTPGRRLLMRATVTVTPTPTPKNNQASALVSSNSESDSVYSRPIFSKTKSKLSHQLYISYQAAIKADYQLLKVLWINLDREDSHDWKSDKVEGIMIVTIAALKKLFSNH